ncbi:hypothetical protein PAUR_b1151 [Pseudoalteromonas aurantia 208]|uniref:Uncharacterized protein n=2 Tax=Pseudoalteromonas aurantia TaxID=43654 RepID=A0ABR9EMR7_9GAMM|nr:hypothetical protein [Pseudoalteromonas aurantia 208]
MITETKYRLLVQEGHLTMSSLIGGLNSLRKANIDDIHRGLFYSGLFELATGFERLMKIVVLLEHKISNNLENPTNKQLRSFGHNICELYSTCGELAKKHRVHIEMIPNDVQNDMLLVLSDFAKGSRYYNLDELTSQNNNKDPIAQWLSVIQYHIWGLRSDVREKLQEDALKYGDVSHWYQNLNGEWITDIDFYYFFTATEKASYHVSWSIISLLRPFYYLLQAQTIKLHDMQNSLPEKVPEDLPHMYEFFSFLLENKSSVLRKKQWVWGK